MIDKIKAFFWRLGVKMGLIQNIKTLSQHRKLRIDEETVNRIQLNKQIYKGYVEEWHNLDFKNSAGELKKRKMKTLGMGKVLAHKMAQLIFNEKCDIDISTNSQNDKLKKFVLETLRNNKFYRDFQRYLEYAYAMSGMAIKPYVSNGKIKLSYAKADSFFPLSHDSQNIDEALFINEEKKGDKYYTLLEWHEWQSDNYVITNELFESTQKNEIGYKVPLSTLYSNLEKRVVIRGLRRPLFVYFKLNTANNKDLDSPLGVSIFENSYDTLYFLDYLFDFYWNEFKLGKRRIAVDYSLLKPRISDDGKIISIFDADETVYKAINTEGSGVTDLSVALRSGDIIQSINATLDIIAMQTGLSSGTFTFDGKSVVTATQVISMNSQTYQTKNSHEVLVEDGIKDLVTTIIDLAILYDLYDGDKEADVVVDFDDSIAEDRTENYRFYSTAVRDRLLDRKRAIMKIFKVTEHEADSILTDISNDEKQDALPPEDVLDLIATGARNRGD